LLAPAINFNTTNFSSRRFRSSSPQTSHSEQASTQDTPKTPLIIVNLNIAPDAKTLAPKRVKSAGKKLPPYCVQYQNSLTKPAPIPPDVNMKVINDFIVQGTIIGNQRRSKKAAAAAAAAESSPDILVECDDTECDDCDTLCDTINMFSNINTDLLLSLDYYEMDSYGRLPGKRHFTKNHQSLTLFILQCRR
jgi:hypothetical protein